MDTLTGTNGGDTFIADNTGSTNAQTGVADSINGGSGTDTLKVFLAAAGAVDALNIPTLTSVENIYINSGTLTSTTTRDVSALAGVVSLELDSPTAMLDGTSFTVKEAATQTLKLDKLNVATTKAATLKLDGVTNLTVNAVGTDTTNNGVLTLDLISTGTTLTLNGTTAVSKFTLADSGAKLATLTITGDKAITLSENIATLTKIDGSAATAAVKVDTSAGTASSTLTFTGGTGNDQLTEKGAAFVKTQILDGGAGTNDMLIISDANTTAFATIATGVNAAKNFETLGFSGTATFAADTSLITSLTQFAVEGAISSTGTNGGTGTGGGAATSVTFTGEGNTQSFIMDAGVTATGGAVGSAGAGVGATGGAATALSIAPLVDNGSNVTTLTLNGVTLAATGGTGNVGAANFNGGDGGVATAVSASSFEVVNIVSNGAATDTTTLTANALTATGGVAGAAGAGGAGAGAIGAAYGLAVGTNATVNVTGAADLNTGLIFGSNVTVSAGALTGKLTVATGSGNDVIVGGSGVNLITLNGGVDSVDLSKSVAKADVVTFSSVSGQDATAGKISSVTGYTMAATTGDKIALSSSASIVSDASNVSGGIANLNVTFVKGVATFSGSAAATATFAQDLSAVFTAMNSAGNKVAAFQFGNDSYLVQDNGTAAAYNAGTDLVIKLVGLTGETAVATTAAANTIFVS